MLILLCLEYLGSALQAPIDRLAAWWRPDMPELAYEHTGEVGPDLDGEFCTGWPAGETAIAYISREIAR